MSEQAHTPLTSNFAELHPDVYKYYKNNSLAYMQTVVIKVEELDLLRKERDDALKKVMELQEAEIKRLKEANERLGNATNDIIEGFKDVMSASEDLKKLHFKVKSPQQETLPVPVPPAVSCGVFG